MQYKDQASVKGTEEVPKSWICNKLKCTFSNFKWVPACRESLIVQDFFKMYFWFGEMCHLSTVKMNKLPMGYSKGRNFWEGGVSTVKSDGSSGGGADIK